MTQLIGMLSTGKGSWAQVNKLISSEKWDSVILITNEFGKEKFTAANNTELLVLNLDDDLLKLRASMIDVLKNRIKGLEVALNIFSGSGKEHMALISAVQNLGVGMRFVDLCNDKMEVL